MTCPYCKRPIHAFTGYQESVKFQKHLGKCRKNPRNIVLSDGKTTVMVAGQQSLMDALDIRYKSGQ